MGRPTGSKNKPKQEAIITDGYANAVLGSGGIRDRSAYTRPRAAMLLQQTELQDLYLGDGFARKIVDIVAEEMTRAGIEVENLDDEKLEELIEAKLEDLNVMKHLADGVRWSRLFGGAIIIFGLNDGGALDVPLNINGIRDVEFLRVYDRWQATIQTRQIDPELSTFGQPELWLISPVQGGSPYTVHNSRVHVFDGDAIPDIMRQANLGWGASALQACWSQLIRLGMSHQWANALIERSQQAVHKIPSLANTLRSPGGEAMVQRRADVVDMVRCILNTVVIDGEEDYTVTSHSMAGVNELMDRFAEALSAVSGFPVSVLMGRAPAGLNATGKADLDNWYARIESMQNDILRDPINKIVSFILMSLTGNSDTQYKIKFNPLVVKSDREEAEIGKLEAETKKLEADTATAYASIGALDANEIRAGLENEYQISGELEQFDETQV
jgi:phage-related protein (TIGR01555 family)